MSKQNLNSSTGSHEYTNSKKIRNSLYKSGSSERVTCTTQRCRSSHRRCSIKKGVLNEYCEIFINTYFEEHLRMAASKGGTV